MTVQGPLKKRQPDGMSHKGGVLPSPPLASAVPLLRADPTRSSETGTVRGLRWYKPPRERKGEVRIGQARRGRAQGSERPMGAATD